jgi:hypothetical protein
MGRRSVILRDKYAEVEIEQEESKIEFSEGNLAEFSAELSKELNLFITRLQSAMEQIWQQFITVQSAFFEKQHLRWQDIKTSNS